MRKLTVLSVCVVLVFGLSFSSSAMASDEEDVLKILEDSIKAINTADTSSLSSLWVHSDKVSSFGPEKAVAFLLQGWEAVDMGNKRLTSLPAGTFSITSHNPKVTMLGDNVALTTAYFIAVITDPSTNAQTIMQARQTLVLQKVNGKWLAVHMHASMLPTE